VDAVDDTRSDDKLDLENQSSKAIYSNTGGTVHMDEVSGRGCPTWVGGGTLVPLAKPICSCRLTGALNLVSCSLFPLLA
jgi:hypothetical protein